MGNTTYPTSRGDFDDRIDIVEYRIQLNNTIFWKGTSKVELNRQLQLAIAQYATQCEDEFRSDGAISMDKNLRITRYFGDLIPESEKWHSNQLTENFDSYGVYFWKSEDIGFNSAATIKASRGKKGERSPSIDCFEEKHLMFKNTGNAVVKFLKSKTF